MPKLKVVNTGDKDYFFTFDCKTYGPLRPNEPIELEDDLAHQAMKKSGGFDDEGFPTEETVKLVSDVDPKYLKLQCPFVLTGQCSAPAFKGTDDLVKHIESHRSKPVGKTLQNQL